MLFCYLCIHLSIHLYLYLSIYLSLIHNLSIHPSIHLSIYESNNLSLYLPATYLSESSCSFLSIFLSHCLVSKNLAASIRRRCLWTRMLPPYASLTWNPFGRKITSPSSALTSQNCWLIRQARPKLMVSQFVRSLGFAYARNQKLRSSATSWLLTWSLFLTWSAKMFPVRTDLCWKLAILLQDLQRMVRMTIISSTWDTWTSKDGIALEFVCTREGSMNKITHCCFQ